MRRQEWNRWKFFLWTKGNDEKEKTFLPASGWSIPSSTVHPFTHIHFSEHPPGARQWAAEMETDKWASLILTGLSL